MGWLFCVTDSRLLQPARTNPPCAKSKAGAHCVQVSARSNAGRPSVIITETRPGCPGFPGEQAQTPQELTYAAHARSEPQAGQGRKPARELQLEAHRYYHHGQTAERQHRLARACPERSRRVSQRELEPVPQGRQSKSGRSDQRRVSEFLVASPLPALCRGPVVGQTRPDVCPWDRCPASN
jgi:hypothetical protein